MQHRWMKWQLAGLSLGIATCGWLGWHWQADNAHAETLAVPHSAESELADGEELFQRNWLPDDPRSKTGDGLGPMFNETSCAGCHNQGGPGGGGATSKNVELLTAFVNFPQTRFTLANPFPNNTGFTVPVTGPGGASGFSGAVPAQTESSGRQPQAGNPANMQKQILEELKTIHPDFATSSSVVIHRFGTSSKHAEWRANLLSPAQHLRQAFQVEEFNPVASADLFPPPSIPVAPTAETPTDSPAPLPEPSVDVFTEPSLPVRPPVTQPRQPQPEPVPFDPQPATLPPSGTVPSNVTFQQVQQVPGMAVANTTTGIPLIDEALQEMRRLQQEARQDLSGQSNRGRVLLLRSQRNTSALFGSGLIDEIPDSVIEAAAKETHPDSPRVSGRVHRLPDHSIGKFGWKAQKATLKDFTLAACANELGLDVPEHAQPHPPYEEGKKTGHDMTQPETEALVAYVRSLPAPIQETPDDDKAAKFIEQGKELFESAGCAVCHKQDMGKAKGIYSDLLLHDMGEQLQASGSYGSFFTPQEFNPNGSESSQDQPQASTENAADPGSQQGENEAPQQGQANQPTAKTQPVAPGEWRTPPLWGVRDSAPYLHDGRAATLEQAIALHGGEGSDAAVRFFMMPVKKRQQMIAFLKTLRAPDQHAAK